MNYEDLKRDLESFQARLSEAEAEYKVAKRSIGNLRDAIEKQKALEVRIRKLEARLQQKIAKFGETWADILEEVVPDRK